MRVNLIRKQGCRVQPAALPRLTALGFYLGFHFLHVRYKLQRKAKIFMNNRSQADPPAQGVSVPDAARLLAS